MRAKNDAVMIGANTAIRDDPRLTVRYVNYPNPVRVVIDGKLKAPTSLRIFNTSEAPTILITSSTAPHDKVEELSRKGVNIIVAESDGSNIVLADALRKLRDAGIKSVLVEGGGELIWGLFREGLVDEYRVTISPYIIGGRDAVTPVGGEGFRHLDEWVKLELVRYILCECGQEVHLVYKVCNNRLLRML